MPNIKISDLPPITLPAVGDESFFEVQTVEAGQDVSRKISLDEIVSTTGLDASFITAGLNAQLPNERVLTAGTGIALTDNGPNSTMVVEATSGGLSGLGVWRSRTETTSPPASGQIRFNNSDPELATELFIAETNDGGTDMETFLALLDDGSLIYIQEQSNSANFIIVEVDTNTDSGTFRTIGIQAVVQQGAALSQNTRVIVVVNITGQPVPDPLLLSDGSAAAPSYSWSSAPSTGIHLIATNLMGFSILGTTNWEMGGLFQAANNAGPAISNVTTSATVPGLLPAQQDPNTGIGSNTLDQLSLIAGGAEIARATAAFNANQFALIQSGSSSVPELTSLADPDTGFGWTGVNTMRWIGGGTRAWNFSTAKFFSQFSNGPALMNEIASATNPTVVPDHSDSDTGLGHTSSNDELSIIAGGVEGLRLAEGASQIIQTNSNQVGLTASVTQTQAGGLALLSSYNEIATVGTTGDALTAFTVKAGDRLIVINNGANDLQLFPAVGDDIGAGVDTAITIAAGDVGIFIGRDATNWDTLFNGAASGGGGANVVAGTVDGQVVIWDVGNNQYEPVSDSVVRINPVSPPTSPLGRISIAGSSTSDVRQAGLVVNIGASISTVWSTNKGGGTQEGFYSRSQLNASTVFHDWGFWDDANQTGITNFTIFDDGRFVFDHTFYMEERAAALADTAGRGQVWVRDDVPNVLVYTDDAGTDFVLNAASPGGGLPLGTVSEASLKWDGISAWIEETQIRLTGGSTGITILDAGLTDNIRIGHDGSNALVRTTGSAEVIFGGGGAGPTTAWRYEQMVRVPDGSAAVPGITWFGDIATGFFRTGAGLSASITGVEQVRIANASTQVASDDFRLTPNFGADLARFIVNGPSNLNDFEIELTSLIDFHVSGSTGERFVLEEFNLAMVEKSAAPADVAGIGQYWVRDDAPNTAMFTNDAGVDKSLVNDVAQARRTTDFELTTAFVDITLDTTDVETDSAVLDHDLVTNTDNIIIGQPGTYKISYEVDIEVDTTGESTITAEGRVRLNDGGVGLPGSDALCGVFSDGSIPGDFMQNHLSQSFYVTLAASDFVTLQLEKVEISGTDDYFATRVLFTAERCL